MHTEDTGVNLLIERRPPTRKINDESRLHRLPESLGWLERLSPHAVVITDAQGVTLWANEMFTRITGFALNDLLGQKTGAPLQCADTDPEAVQVLSRAISEGRDCHEVEVRYQTKDGKPLWLMLNMVPVHDPAGNLTHFFSLQSDVTAHHLVRDERRHGVSLLQDMGLIGFWQRDLATGQGQWDAVCRSIWGLQESEAVLSMEQMEQCLSGSDLDAVRRYQIELAAGATRGDLSYTLGTPGGHRHVRALWRREAQTVSGVLIDTTSEHAVTAERARLLQALTLAAPAAQLVFWRHDLRSGVVHWMPPGHHPFQVDEQDCSQSDVTLSSVLAEDRPAVVAARDRAMRVQDVVELEYRVCDRQGAVRHLLTRRLGLGGPDGPGGPGAQAGRAGEIIGVLIDVTTQREREIALRRLGTQQALALKALRAGCYRFDLAKACFEFDDAMLRLYGLPTAASRLPFGQWLERVHPEDRARVQQQASALFNQPCQLAPERFRIHHADGHTLWIETDRVPEHDAKGRVTALVGTHRNVTSEVLADAQTRALADAQLVARTRTEFLATLAHELRTPLNAVAGFAQLLQLGPPGGKPDPAVAASALHIQVAGQMMVALLDDLGDLASADAGALRWQGSHVPVQALISDSCAWLQQRDSGAARRIRVDAMAAGLALWADPSRTRQILLNLLSNALKYSDGEIEVRAQQAPDGIQIAVCDAGPGLDAAQVARAFEPFERLGRERGHIPGSGLGLAVCRRLSRLMGGDIDVRSMPGQGSQFILLLPAQGQVQPP